MNAVESLEWPSPRRVAYALGSLALAVVVLAVVVHSVPMLVGAKASYVVLSGSMEPAISPGDVTVVYEGDPSALAVGDVVTYARVSNPIPVTHRVVAVVDADGGPAYRTQGDANEDPDPGLVASDQVVGVVPSVDLPVLGPTLLVVPLLGYLVEFARTPLGIAVLVVAPLGLLLAFELRDLLESRREELAGETEADADDASGRASEAPVEADADAVAEAESGDASGAGASDGFAVDAGDLRYTTGALAAFTGYGALVAVLLTEVWAVVVAVALGGLTVMLVGVQRGWFAADADPSADADVDAGAGVPASASERARATSDEAAAAPVRVVDVPDAAAATPAFEVESLADLQRLASQATAATLDDVSAREYVVFDGANDVRYVCPYGDAAVRHDGGETPAEEER